MSIFRSDTSGQALAYRDFVQREERFVRAPYNPELEFYQAVVSGNLKKIKEMTKESFLAKKEGWGTLSANPVQNVKYHFAITAAVIARYCINAGMDLHVAYNLSDYYISAADRCHTPEEIASLHTPLCLDYTRRMKELIKQNVCSQPVVKCIDYIYDHLHTRITLTQLSEIAGLSPSYLSRLFQKETGQSISSYICEQKINTARNMLLFSSYSSAEIAAILAFPSQSYFSGTFKKKTGMTPSDYRLHGRRRAETLL